MSKTLRELPLATATVSGDLFHVSGSDLLDKRISIDDIAVGIRQTLKGGLVADEDVVIESGGLLKATSNIDAIHELSRAKVWGASDVAYFSHFDRATATAYALGQNPSGSTFLNAAAGQSVFIRNNNGNVASFDGANIIFNKPVTINGTGTILQVAPNTDISASIGRGRLGLAVGGSLDDFYISHYDQFTANNYGIRIVETGFLALNAPSSELVAIRNNNNSVATFGGTQLDFLQPAVITKDTYQLLSLDRTANASVSKIFGLAVSTTDALDIRNVTDGTVLTRFTNAGRVVIGDLLDNTVDLLQVGFGTDASASIGRVKLGFNGEDPNNAFFAHTDNFNASSFALQQNSVGATVLNAASSQKIFLRNNDTDVMLISDTSIDTFQNLILHDRDILRPDNTSRTILCGGTSPTATDAGYIIVEGADYTGVGVGGNIAILPTVDANLSILRSTSTGRVIIKGTDNTVDLLQIAPNTDISASIGRGRLGFTSSTDIFYISHYDQFTANNYGIACLPSGALILNAGSGETVSINNGGSSVLATYGTTSIDLFNKTTIQGNSTDHLTLYTPSNIEDVNISGLHFSGQNSTNTKISYASIHSSIEDNTAGTEDGRLYLKVRKGGTLVDALRITHTGSDTSFTFDDSSVLNMGAGGSLRGATNEALKFFTLASSDTEGFEFRNNLNQLVGSLSRTGAASFINGVASAARIELAGASPDDIYQVLVPYVPNVGNEVKASGGGQVTSGGGNDPVIASQIRRISSTQIEMDGLSFIFGFSGEFINAVPGGIIFTQGNTTGTINLAITI